jgi:glycosyltransferase involved in cell wall biosynthesis
MPELKPYLLHVGAHQAQRNIPMLVRAFRRLSERGLWLILVGSDHNDSPNVERAIAGEQRIVKLGYRSDGELAWLYEHALGLVFPSLYEGFGMPLLDAMSRGCPVITSDRSSLPELAGGAALIIDPEDEGALESAIARLVDQPGMRDKLAAAGRQRSGDLTWAAAAEATVRAYAAAIEAG